MTWMTEKTHRPITAIRFDLCHKTPSNLLCVCVWIRIFIANCPTITSPHSDLWGGVMEWVNLRLNQNGKPQGIAALPAGQMLVHDNESSVGSITTTGARRKDPDINMPISQFQFLFKIHNSLVQWGIQQWCNYLITSETARMELLIKGSISTATKRPSSDCHFWFPN